MTSERPPLLTDPNWVDRVPGAQVRAAIKGIGAIVHVVWGLIILAWLGVMFVVALRLLHAAWGH